MIELRGISASKGIAIGRLHVIDHGRTEAVERHIAPDAVEAEVARFDVALNIARAELQDVKRQIPPGTPSDIAAFIDTHLLMLHDAAIERVPVAHIREARCNAEWALKLQHDALVSVFDAMDDEYLRTRSDDVGHVVQRVMHALNEHPAQAQARARGVRSVAR